MNTFKGGLSCRSLCLQERAAVYPGSLKTPCEKDRLEVLLVQLDRNTEHTRPAYETMTQAKRIHFDNGSNRVTFPFFLIVFSSRNRKNLLSSYRILVKVWKNSKKLWKHSPEVSVSTVFLVIASFHSCFVTREKQESFFVSIKLLTIFSFLVNCPPDCIFFVGEMRTRSLLDEMITVVIRVVLSHGVLDSGSSGPGSSPGRGHRVVFLRLFPSIALRIPTAHNFTHD